MREHILPVFTEDAKVTGGLQNSFLQA